MSIINLISIKPCDNTFFRDGQVFERGINSFISSKNTPYPSVFFGAIFTMFLAENDNFKEMFFHENRYDHEEILTIGQTYLLNNETKAVYVSAPKDLFINKYGDIAFGKFREINQEYHSLPFKTILENPKMKDYQRITHQYINLKNIFDAYREKQYLRIELKDEEDIFKKNKKIGIGLSKETKIAEESMLYQIEQTEFASNHWSFLVEYKIDAEYLALQYKGVKVQDLNKGYLKLGGENKACKFEKVENQAVKKFCQDKAKTKRELEVNNTILKIILTSDLFLEENIENIFEDKIKLIGLANDKPIYIGGYDLEKRQARKMYKGYGAGTILLMEVDSLQENSEEICQMIAQKLGQSNPRGFGKYVIMKGEYSCPKKEQKA